MGAVSLGSGIFLPFWELDILAAGYCLGSTHWSLRHSVPAANAEDCHRSLVQGIYLSLALTPLLSAPVLLLPALLRSMQVDIAMVALA